MIAKLPEDESSRLEILHQLELLDTPPEPEFDELVSLAAAICDTPISHVTLVDEHRQWFKASFGLSAPETSRAVAFCAHAILQKSLFTINDATKDKRFADNPLVVGEPKIRFYAGMPISASTGSPLGTLCVIDRVPRELTPEQNSALEVLGRQVNARLELRMKRRNLNEALVEKQIMLDELHDMKAELELANFRLEKLATTDELTGLRNRRVFDERLVEEFALALQRNKRLSLALIDIDNFKARNDRYGRPSGDAALKQFARVLRSVMRRTDIAVRYGGEEFALLLLDSTADQARFVAERVLTAVRTAVWPDEQLTVSIGLAEFDRAIDLTETTLVARADVALYDAKHAGKNQSRIARPNPTLAS